uniref:Uncharacterized protein n=1 Tax=Schistosoma curassoni TaxID=6186 RepID=A0A183L1Y3_9TREM
MKSAWKSNPYEYLAQQLMFEHSCQYSVHEQVMHYFVLKQRLNQFLFDQYASVHHHCKFSVLHYVIASF